MKTQNKVLNLKHLKISLKLESQNFKLLIELNEFVDYALGILVKILSFINNLRNDLRTFAFFYIS